MAKQTKFSALIPQILSATEAGEYESGNMYFWHSFFLLKPEFVVMQTALSGNYHIEALRQLIARCLEVIATKDEGSVASMRRANASYLLVQMFESLWARMRVGTFGVDAINVLCGLDQSQVFFDGLFSSVLQGKDSDPALVLLSLLSATRDVQTNALTDFFTEKCGEITVFCETASDLHILLFSLLLQLDRPTGPFVQHFKSMEKSRLGTLVSNLLARCAQLYVCCRPQEQGLFRKQTSKTQNTAKLGLFMPGDYALPMCFALFEPFVDAAILCFHELSSLSPDATLVSMAVALLSFVVSSPGTAHSGDRLKMSLIAFEFLFDANENVVGMPFDHQQVKSFFNHGVCECRESSVGAMALDVVSFLLEMKRGILPVSHYIGRIVYAVVSALVRYRGNHNVNWRRLFDRLFAFCNRTRELTCEFNGYLVATVAACSSFRAALFKRDDGYIHMLQALAKESAVGQCVYRAPDAFRLSADLLKKCKTHVQKLSEVATQHSFGDAQFAQVEAQLPDLKVDVVPHDAFTELDKLSECPDFTQFFHVFARQHCENVQALLHFAVSHV